MTQYADTVRHVQVDTPNWDTKVRCSCGAEFVSRCEFWKHGYDLLSLVCQTERLLADRLAEVIRAHGPFMDDECRGALALYDAARQNDGTVADG